MIRSMTGFGKAVVKTKYGAVTVEIKALNHKFFELSSRLPNGLSEFEDDLKQSIHQKIRRSKIYLNIDINGQKEASLKMTINNSTAERYVHELTKLKTRLRLGGEIKVDQLIMLPGVLVAETASTSANKIIPYIKDALNRALKDLIKARVREGKALYKDLLYRIKNIHNIVEHIDKRSSVSVIKYKNHITKMVKELAGAKGMDKGRLEQEVALFAKNCDVSEELTRLRSHISSFKESLRLSGECGKKLDFIAQELQRETNTIASKSSDFQISKGAIQIKSEIEKIREQAKNVE